MSYILKRTDQSSGYVAKSGCSHSYTNKIAEVLRFATYEEAKTNACGNEIVVNLDQADLVI
jgi:hypothetical protein